MTYARKLLGDEAEDLARQLLEQKKHKILGQKVKTKIGEIDLLTQDGDHLVIVEVKGKSSDSFGTAKDMIDYKKKRKLIALAGQVQQRFKDFEVRIDAVAVDWGSTPPKVEYIKNAVTADDWR